MDLVTKYIMTHSDGRSHPICGSAIAAAFCVSSVEVRRLVNAARTNGDPICSSGRGYYIAKDKDEIQKTIESLQGRIAGMSNAVSGLQQYMEGALYDSLFYSNPSLNRLYIANIIQWHMRPFELERDPHSGKAQKRFKKLVGNKLYSDVMKLHAADIEAKGT